MNKLVLIAGGSTLVCVSGVDDGRLARHRALKDTCGPRRRAADCLAIGGA